MLQGGVILSDYATLVVETLQESGRPEAMPVYDAIDMDWMMFVGQVPQVRSA